MRRIADNAGLVALLLLGLAVALGVASCGSRQDSVRTANKSLAVAYEATQAARVAFSDWEANQHPEEAGTTEAEALAALQKHEAVVRRVSGAFAVAYTAIAAASDLLALVDAGKREPAELLGAVSEAVAALQRLKVAVRAAVGQ